MKVRYKRKIERVVIIYFHSLVPLTWRTSDWLTTVISGPLASLPSVLLVDGAAAVATANRTKIKN